MAGGQARAEHGFGLAPARGDRWLPARPVRDTREAAEWIEDVGFALLFPAGRVVAPSLWEAVAGPDEEPFAAGMGPAESMVWAWKDELPRLGLAWYGKFLAGRATLLSPRLLAALYTGAGEPVDHRALPVSEPAHHIAEALLTGPLPSSSLRRLVGHSARYDRALRELHAHLLVTSAGVREQASGWPAAVIELTCRLFDVGGRTDLAYAAARFLDTAVQAKPADLARAFGWPAGVAEAELSRLAAAGQARLAGGTYRSDRPGTATNPGVD